MATKTSLTATELLRQRHQEIKTLFTETLDASGQHRSELFDCLRATLAVHETVEEMFVHPLARAVSDQAAMIVEQRLQEENEAKRVLADLEKLTPDGEGFGPQLLQFHNAVLQHAEAEELELFPLIDANCSADDRRKLADLIVTSEQLVPTHPHPHAGENPVALLIVGPFAAMVDKARDAIKDATQKARNHN